MRKHTVTRTRAHDHGSWTCTCTLQRHTARAYAEHYESDHTRAFLDALAKHDIAYELQVLAKPRDVAELVRCVCVCGGGGGQGACVLVWCVELCSTEVHGVSADTRAHAHALHSPQRAAHQRRPPSKGQDEKRMAHVLIRYSVKPSAQGEFLKAWGAAEKGTGVCARALLCEPGAGVAVLLDCAARTRPHQPPPSPPPPPPATPCPPPRLLAHTHAYTHTHTRTPEGEQGAHIYSLRRVVARNTEFYAYGTWASMKDYAAHFE
jgi:quinol monooxygenase YgiN